LFNVWFAEKQFSQLASNFIDAIVVILERDT